MRAGWLLVALALLPPALWLLGIAVVAVRGTLRRRGDERTRRLRLARMFGRGLGGDVVVVPTADVDLPEHTVLEVAAGAGFRFIGYERADTPLRGRVGVFVRVGGQVDAVIRGPLGPGERATSAVHAGRAPAPR